MHWVFTFGPSPGAEAEEEESFCVLLVLHHHHRQELHGMQLWMLHLDPVQQLHSSRCSGCLHSDPAQVLKQKKKKNNFVCSWFFTIIIDRSYMESSYGCYTWTQSISCKVHHLLRESDFDFGKGKLKITRLQDYWITGLLEIIYKPMSFKYCLVVDNSFV